MCTLYITIFTETFFCMNKIDVKFSHDFDWEFSLKWHSHFKIPSFIGCFCRFWVQWKEAVLLFKLSDNSYKNYAGER